MNRKSIQDATPEELRQFARVMGLEIGDREQSGTVLEKLRTSGYTSDEITIFEATTPKATGKAGVVKDEKGRDCMMILIPEEDGPGGQDDVPVGVNGVVFQIKRGQPVKLPLEYIEVLNNAVEYRYPTAGNGQGGIAEPRKVPAIPYQIVPAA